MRPSSYRRWGKRALDTIIALVLLIALLPILLVTALLVRLNLGAPIFFRQQRPGMHGRPFWIVKFRTMREDSVIGASSDETRLTPFGRFLRSTSLDELPELINVVGGSMSLVGPRPLLMEYLGRYSPRQSRRHEAMPGITGWAQIKGRNAISWEEKFEYDIWYVDHMSLILDLKILAQTVLNVAVQKDVSARGCATMPEFKG